MSPVSVQNCRAKKKYLDKGSAYRRVLGQKRFDKHLSAYQCPVCGFWHLTTER